MIRNVSVESNKYFLFKIVCNNVWIIEIFGLVGMIVLNYLVNLNDVIIRKNDVLIEVVMFFSEIFFFV